jgi:Tfp pilus assembly protein PilO
MKDEDRLETLFLATLTRRPSDRERDVLLASVTADGADRGTVFADIMWALLNSPEFVLSR